MREDKGMGQETKIVVVFINKANLVGSGQVFFHLEFYIGVLQARGCDDSSAQGPVVVDCVGTWAVR